MTSLSARERRSLAEIERHLTMDRRPRGSSVAWTLLLVSWVAAALLFGTLLSGSPTPAFAAAAIVAGAVGVSAHRLRTGRSR